MVLDTNVMVSGLLNPRGLPGKILAAWRAGHFELLMSVPMLDELSRVLRYPKIHRLTGMTNTEIDDFIFIMRTRVDIVDIPQTGSWPDLRDPDDYMIAETCNQGEADWLVSGDEDLLVLKDSLPVVSPADFASRL